MIEDLSFLLTNDVHVQHPHIFNLKLEKMCGLYTAFYGTVFLYSDFSVFKLLIFQCLLSNLLWLLCKLY